MTEFRDTNQGDTGGRPAAPSPVSDRGGKRIHPAQVAAVALIALGLVILVYPFIPIVRYELFRPAPSFPYATRLESTNGPTLRSDGRLPEIGDRLPEENRLVIPKIGVNMPIVEGKDEGALFRGSWRIPDTSTPDRGGNTVLTVHRFQYLAGPNTLALADRLTDGDLMIVYWKGPDGVMTEYDYRITATKLVEPTAVEILDNTAEPKLTLFTCAPMFSTKQRLVLDGTLITG